MHPFRVKAAPVAMVMAALLTVWLLLTSPPEAPSISTTFKNAMTYDADDKPYEDLVSWLLKSGAEFSAVSGHSRALAGGGRGLFAQRHITQGEVIIRIPAECWISHRSILRSSTAAHVLREDKVLQAVIAEEQTWAMVIGMEYERHNPYSPWKEYLHFMRRQESTLWWTRDELTALHSPKILRDTLKASKDLDDMYDRVYPHLFKTYPHMWTADENTKESFYWSALTMWGRAFDVTDWSAKSTVGTEYGLVPIADLLNHDGGRQSTWYMEHNDGVRKDDPTAYVFEANRETAKGGEIMISYGDHQSSCNFFMWLGFIPSGQTYGDYNGLVVYRGDEVKLEAAIGNDGRVNKRFLDALAGEMKVKAVEAAQLLLNAVTKLLASHPTAYGDDLTAFSRQGLEYREWGTLAFRTRFKRIYIRFQENLEYMLDTGMDTQHQKYAEDTDNEAHTINAKELVKGAAEFALDELRIDL